MAEILKGKYILGARQKEDNIGILFNGVIKENGQPISIRAYHSNFCHSSLVQKLQDIILQTAGLNHPGLVRIINTVYTENGRFFIVYDTPYQDSLAAVLQKIPSFPLKESKRIILDIAKTLQYTHQYNFLHGALNPDNIEMLPNGEIKLRNLFIDQWLNSLLLKKGQNLLDVAYLAPEQVRSAKSDKTTDIFALGILFYHLLSGTPPFPIITSLPQILKNYQKMPARLIGLLPEIPSYIESIIFKALQPKQKYRQQSVTEFIGDLRLKKVTITVEELKRRDAAGILTPPLIPEQPIAPQTSEKPQEYVNIDPILDSRIKLLGKKPTMQKTSNPPEQKPQKQNSEDKARKLLIFALCGVFAAMLVLFVNALFFNSFNSIPRVEIPDVIHMSREAAVQTLEAYGLRVKFGGYINSQDITPNYVLETKPEVGRTVKKGRIIILYFSQQSEGIAAPNLIEHSLQSAAPLVLDRGLTLNIVERIYSNKYAANQIISQSPEPNSAVKRGDKINVTVSNGYPVWLTVEEKTPTQIRVSLFTQNQPDWEPQNVLVYLQDRKSRRKYAERILQPGERHRLEITTDPDGIIEVYYFNEQAFRRELKYLENPQ